MGFIRPFNATHSHEYRAKVMDAFAKGEVFILICTDLFGMGCNLPDIRLSVQWKRPSSVSSFIQRAGRAARGPGTKGLAVLLVEASAYQAKKAPAPKAGRSKGKRKTKSQPNAAVPPIEPGSEFPDSFDALISKSSSATCRRKSILGIFGHEGSGRPTVPCCDVCCPELLELVKPRGHTKKRKAKANLAVRGVVQPVVQNALLRWRDDMLAQHHPHAAYASDVILPDSAIDLLASVGPIDSLEYLKELLQMDGWYWWEKHGARLFDFLSSVTIPPLEPLPTVPIATSGHLKRPISVLEDQPVTSHPPSSRQAPVPAQSVSTAITAHSTPQPATKRPRPSTTTPAIGPRLVSQSHPSQVVQGTPQPTPPVWPPKLIPPVTPHPQARGPPTSFWPTPLPTPRPQVMSSSSTSFPSFKDPNAADYLRAFQAFHSQQVPPPATPK
ncbi:hypothetical protein FRB90_009995 [Tulasnella sp. 427]|nr:hypothetical protein FRB90_009995 [Tulasnella sp. 427]